MHRPGTDIPIADQDAAEVESYLDKRLASASGLLGVALIEIDVAEWGSAVELLADHVDAEDHVARLGERRLLIVRSPLVGPAEMEGLALRVADSFPSGTVHVEVATGGRGDRADTLLRVVESGLADAKTFG